MSEIENTRHYQDALEAAKQTARVYNDIVERLENADSEEDLERVYSMLQKIDDGDHDNEQAHWVEIRLADYFIDNDQWDNGRVVLDNE